MAQKRINDLTLRSDFDDTCNFPVDDLVQTWRTTGAQVKTYLETNLAIARANLSSGAVGKLAVDTATGTYNADGTKDLILGDSSGGSVTVNLPAAASHTGRRLIIKKTSASNSVIIDGNASETIDGLTTQTLTENYQSLSIVSNGTSWSIV
jgi:hypothetical protein